MIKLLEDNMMSACIQLMLDTMDTNDAQLDNEDEHDQPPYERNERSWILHLSKHIEEQNSGNPNYLAIGEFSDEGELKGFMLASSFINYYSQDVVMDVKDCIVNHKLNTVFIATRLFDYMIDHVRKHGGTHWRADSIRSNKQAVKYTKFLAKKYDAIPFYGVHGRIDRR